jgi:hypothetical protein
MEDRIVASEGTDGKEIGIIAIDGEAKGCETANGLTIINSKTITNYMRADGESTASTEMDGLTTMDSATAEGQGMEGTDIDRLLTMDVKRVVSLTTTDSDTADSKGKKEIETDSSPTKNR